MDESFGDGGLVWLKYPGSGANDVAVQADGKIIVGGYIGGAQGGAALVRLLPNGSLDPTFGSNGLVVSYREDNYVTNAVAVQPDGRILGTGTTNGSPQPNFVTRRHLGDGGLDPTFGDAGVVVTSYGSTRAAYPAAIVVQPDGKVLVSGSSETATPGTADYTVVRYNADGSLDPMFGIGGKVNIDIHGTRDALGFLALQPDGKILVAGTTSVTGDDPGNTDATAVRLNADGALDTSFVDAGRFTTDSTARRRAAGSRWTARAVSFWAGNRAATSPCSVSPSQGRATHRSATAERRSPTSAAEMTARAAHWFR